jgi:hypothetical protein
LERVALTASGRNGIAKDAASERPAAPRRLVFALRLDPLQLVVEIKGRRTEEDQAKADTLASLWLPAVRNDGRFGRWGPPVEIVQPYDMANALETMVKAFETAAGLREKVS